MTNRVNEREVGGGGKRPKGRLEWARGGGKGLRNVYNLTLARPTSVLLGVRTREFPNKARAEGKFLFVWCARCMGKCEASLDSEGRCESAARDRAIERHRDSASSFIDFRPPLSLSLSSFPPFFFFHGRSSCSGKRTRFSACHGGALPPPPSAGDSHTPFSSRSHCVPPPRESSMTLAGIHRAGNNDGE